MVDIQGAILLRLFAHLTMVVIPFTCGATLYIPIGAIIFFVSTAPIGAVPPNTMLGLPNAITCLIAKVGFMMLHAKRNNEHRLSATRTKSRDAVICRIIRASYMIGVILRATSDRAKEVLRACYFVRRALQRCAALCAVHRYLLIPWVIFAYLMRCIPIAGASWTAKGVLASRHVRSVAIKCLMALFALIGFGGHKKPLTDKLVTCSGFTAISKGVRKVYHGLSVQVNPEQFYYTIGRL